MMREKTYDYPFTAIVGQEPMKEAILINLVNPSAGGVLIRGQKGTAKTTAVRAIPGLMKDCRVVEIPANATEDRVAGTIDIEAALKDGEKQFQPGLLKEADGNILYVDEINLLDDHIVDLLLDAAATGRNTVEREGISCTHSARFVLIGSMNPEEGNLRPQLLDRLAWWWMWKQRQTWISGCRSLRTGWPMRKIRGISAGSTKSLRKSFPRESAVPESFCRRCVSQRSC